MNIKKKSNLTILFSLVIIGLICLIIFIVQCYQPETELPPSLFLKTNTGEEVELLLLSYDWNYNGEHKASGEGMDVKSLITYDFEGKNTLIRNFEWGIKSIEISTSPKYKAKFLSTSALRYNDRTDNYESNPNTNIGMKGKTEFTYIPTTGTTLITFTLNSKKQGTAVYGLKIVEQYCSDIDKLTEIKNLNLDKNEISNFLKEETFGQYLNNIELENNKVTLTYDYYVPEYVTLMFTNELFALVDDLEVVEFKTSFNKFKKNVNDPITYEHTEYEIDNAEPIVYSREGFKDTFLDLSLKEFRSYIGK